MEKLVLKVLAWVPGPASHLGRAKGLAAVVGEQKCWSNGVAMGEQES